MDVSIILVNFNTLKLTEDTIKSINDKTKNIKYEIILVDNNSKDGSQKYFEKKYKKIKLIKSKQNLGFGKANNLGVEKAKGKYIFLLNTDTILLNNAIKILYDYMEKNICVGVCGGNLYFENMEPAHSFSSKKISLNSEIQELFFIPNVKKIILKRRNDFNYSETPVEVSYITGADIMMRKELFERTNGFDKDFFMYYEEAELMHRIKKLNYKIFSVPQAKIIHLEGKSFSYKEKRLRMTYESRYKYFEKVFGIKAVYNSYLILNFKYLLRFFLTLNTKYVKMLKLNIEIFGKHRRLNEK